MISVTYFALENIAMPKVDVHQDQGGQHEDGQGQVSKWREDKGCPSLQVIILLKYILMIHFFVT